jgi:glycine/D-amino acid oxidase-like deaminating enzyme
VFPQLKGVDLAFAWGGHIDLTLNRTPDVGRQRDRYWLGLFRPRRAADPGRGARAVSDAILGQADELALYQV